MPTDPTTRRGYLGLAACAAAGLAGCTNDPGMETDGPATDVPSTETAPTSTAGEPTLRLEPVAPRELRTTGRVAVHPPDLTGWIRAAATAGRTLREHASTVRENPDPPLSILRDVRLVDETSDLEGHYDLEVDAGTRYELLVGAERTDPPSDTTVTAVSDLTEARRDLAVGAIEDGSSGVRVYPETELGEWARESFFGGHYRYDGETYRGYEVQRTDAASLSDEAWYVISATPSRGGDDDTYLVLPDLDEGVRAELEAAGLGGATDELRIEDPSEGLVEYALGTAVLLTHHATFRTVVEQP